MRTRYLGAQDAALDQEDGDYNLIPGAWREVQALADAQNVTALQTQDSKFQPWRSGAEHTTSRSRGSSRY